MPLRNSIPMLICLGALGLPLAAQLPAGRPVPPAPQAPRVPAAPAAPGMPQPAPMPPAAPAPTVPYPMQAPAQAPAATPPLAAGVGPRLSLAQALRQAAINSPSFQAAVTAVGVAQAAHTQARAALLPALTFEENYLWTQTNRYVANDGPHEYQSLGHLHEALNFGSGAALRRSQAGVALAQAQREIAARGLNATITQDYYTLLSAGHKLSTAEQALRDAQKYLKDSQALERGGEVAHADVVKAQIQAEQRQAGLEQAQLAEQQAKLALAVLIFPNFDQNFSVVDDLNRPPALPSEAQAQQAAGVRNPILNSAQDAEDQARQDVSIARASLLPSASLDYYYGIDAHEFALYNQYHEPNLGSYVVGMLSIPLFDWGGNRAKLRQAHLQETQAQRELSYTQRQLRASLITYYAEAQSAYRQISILRSSRDLSAESLRLTALRYRDGEATILELVDAQNTLILASDAYDDGQVRYRVALANLEALTGVL